MQSIQLLFYGLLVFLQCAKCKQCLNNHEHVIVAKKHFKLPGSGTPLVPLRLHYGHRISQQISTHILHILAEEVLGYEDVVLVNTARDDKPEEVLAKLAGTVSTQDNFNNGISIPEIAIDTEVWLPTDFPTNKWLDKKKLLDAGAITSHGRYGWYIPKDFVQTQWDSKQVIADHWRAFELDGVFSRLLHNVTGLKEMQNLTEIQHYCKSRAVCLPGFFTTKHCPAQGHMNSNCAVVLAEFPSSIDKFARQQMTSLNLNATLLWLGSAFPSVVSEALNRSSKPFILLNWEPNTLTSTGKLTRVFLPACRSDVSIMDSNSTFNCDFPLMHLKKFAWSRVKSGAPGAYHVLEKMYLTRKDLHEMLQQHIDTGGAHSSREIACDWLRTRRDVWSPWLPDGVSYTGKIPVYLGGMFPMSEDKDAVWSNPGILAGAQMALQRVNTDPSLLTNYSLELTVDDTSCQTSHVLNSYIQFVSNRHSSSLAGILGPACSVQAEIVAEVAPFYNTMIMGYSLEGVNLANRKKYPLFFRTSPSYFEFKKAYASLFGELDWQQYATLTDVNYISTTVTATHEHLDDKGIKLVYSRIITLQEKEDIRSYLKSIKRINARIIIGNLFEGVARAVVCEAYKQGMTPKNGYVWFLPYWLSTKWWEGRSNSSSNISIRSTVEQHVKIPCTAEEMREFVSGGYFSLSNSFYGDEADKVVGGTTVERWKDEYEAIISRKGYAPSEYASFAYDAVWAYALALDKLFTRYPSSLDTMRTNITTSRLKNYIQQSNFTGVSGQVVFKDGERFLPAVTVLQHFNDRKELIGQFVPGMTGHMACSVHGGCLHLNHSRITWPGGRRPSDGRPEMSPTCAVEAFRALIGLSCDGAIAVINVIAIGLFLILVISLLWFCIKRRYDQKYKTTQQRMEELGLMELSPVLKLDEWELPRENVVLNRKLGEGAFGTVFGGEAKGIRDHKEWVPVAVKTLKIGSTPEEKLEFLSEAETMKMFEHQNIVKLLGVCTKGEPAFAVMELMIHGDLKNFLLARRQFTNQHSKEAEDVSAEKLTRMALDITSGLAYLSSLNFVHRDLALRNCMVGSGHVVKLGDFGMTRAMYDSDYYRFGRKGMLPVRWMAPESLTDGVFTAKSDVWGLGVTLWELCTMGSFPYQGMSNAEVLNFVQEEHSMEIPPGANAHFVELLKSCWAFDPNSRPDPDKVIELLKAHPDMVKSCMQCPTTSVPTRDDSGGSNGDTAPSTPKISGRKISRNLRPKTWSPNSRSPNSRSPASQRGTKITQLTEEQLRTILRCHTPQGTPSLERKSQASSTSRMEEFV